MSKGKKKVKLGDSARDSISGFAGIVTCVSKWINGCVRVNISPREMKDGVPIKSQCFDVEQVEIVKSGAFEIGNPSGGDREDATRPQCPSR